MNKQNKTFEWKRPCKNVLTTVFRKKANAINGIIKRIKLKWN